MLSTLKNSSAGHYEFPTFVGKQCVDSFNNNNTTNNNSLY